MNKEIAELAARLFDMQERIRILEMVNVPIDYKERKKAFIDLALARNAVRMAEKALYEGQQ